MGTHHCRRCDMDVQGEFEQPRMRRLVKLYFLLPVPFVPFLPMIASDFAVMIPLTMLYLIGMGPALRIINAKPTCPECGAFVDKV